MGDSGTTGDVPPDVKDSNPEYIAFGLVPVFFLLGLLGVLICHALKKKGYRCTTEAEDAEEADDELDKDLERGDLNDTYSEGNTDTVGQIVHYIMKNEANTDALKAMIHENSIDSEGPVTPTSPITPTTPGTPGSPRSPVWPPGGPAAALATTKHTCNHLHTIGGAAGQKNICNRCNQKKWPLMRRHSAKKIPDRRSHLGEVTVLAVGRFRVTKCDPKSGKERRTLLITEPNGTVSAAPAAEAGPDERPPSQALEETDAK